MERRSSILRILVFCLFFYSCSKKVSQISFSEQIDSFRAVKTDGGVIEWVLEADKLLKKDNNFVLSPRLWLYENGEESAFCRAETGFFEDDFSSAEIEGDVEINLKDKTKIFLENLKWDGEKKVFYTSRPVKQVTETSIIEGDGLLADENFERVEIKNPKVTARIQG
jgi:LPS export ABC transporter protein LptC